MKNTLKTLLILTLSFLIIAGSAACGQKPVTSEEREKGEAIVGNLIDGIEKKDYAIFSADFDATMKDTMKESNFQELTDLFDQSIGAYESRTLTESKRILNAGTELLLFSYKAKYDKEQGDVSILVYLSEKDGVFQIAGFNYNSEALRETGKGDA